MSRARGVPLRRRRRHRRVGRGRRDARHPPGPARGRDDLQNGPGPRTGLPDGNTRDDGNTRSDGNTRDDGNTRSDGNTRNGAFPVPSRRLAAARHDASPVTPRLLRHPPDHVVLGVASSDGSLRLAKLVDDEDAETDENGAERSPSSPSRSRTSSIVALASLEGHRGEVNDVAFHRAGGPFAATASDDGTCVTWDAARAAPVGEASGHAAAVYGAAYAPASFGGGDAFATCSFDRTVRACGTRGRRETRRRRRDPAGIRIVPLHPVACVATFRGHDDDVVGVDFHPRGTVVASGSDDGTCRAWDLRPSAIFRRFEFQRNVAGRTPRPSRWPARQKRVRFSPSGDAIAVGGGTGGVRRRRRHGRRRRPARTRRRGVRRRVDSRAERIVSASHDNTWRTWWIE